jgi:hypothetical protein
LYSSKGEASAVLVRTRRAGTGSNASELLSLLVDYAPCVAGLESTQVADYKLPRAENLRFVNQDKIVFSIERHGAAALSSAYGEIQDWEIDLSSDTASRSEGGRRRINPTVAPFTKHDAADLANRVFTNIENQKDDGGGIKFLSDGRVAILIGHYVPDSGPAQSVAGRRKRFRSALKEEAERRGWRVAKKAPGNCPTFIRT